MMLLLYSLSFVAIMFKSLSFFTTQMLTKVIIAEHIFKNKKSHKSNLIVHLLMFSHVRNCRSELKHSQE